jgi:hypothetical protein
MFKRPQRQVVATLLLIVGSIVPTVATIGYVWRMNARAHVEAYRRVLEQRLGLRVELGGLRHPRPGEDEIRGIVLREPEPVDQPSELQGAELARADVARVKHGVGELAVEVEGLRFWARDLAAALEQVEGLLRRWEPGGAGRVSLLARQCAVEWGEGKDSVRLRDLASTVSPEGAGAAWSASFRVERGVPGARQGGGATRCELAVRRELGGAAPRTLATFRTMDGTLPVSAWESLGSVASWIDRRGEWRGEMTLRSTASRDWELEYTGEIDGLDLGVLTAGRAVDERVSGRGRLVVEQARWGERGESGGPGWVEARGVLTAGRGMIGHGLMERLAVEQLFRVQIPEGGSGGSGREGAAPGAMAYEALGVRFELDGAGKLTLTGALGGENPPDAVMTAGGMTVLWASGGSSTARVLAKAVGGAGAEGEPLLRTRMEQPLAREPVLPGGGRSGRGASTGEARGGANGVEDGKSVRQR